MLNICWAAWRTTALLFWPNVFLLKISIIVSLLRKEDSCHCNYSRGNVPAIVSKSFCFSTLSISTRWKRKKCWRILKEIPATETCAFLCYCSADVLHFHSTIFRIMENYDWNKQINKNVGMLNWIFQVIQKKDLEVRMNTTAVRWTYLCKQYLRSYSHCLIRMSTT